MPSERSFSSLVDQCVFLAGPTAAGKSEVGVELAELLHGEILSLDSIAIYRRMDIGTAKPSAALRARVRHHLLDLIEPHETFSITQYLRAAHQAVEEIRGRGRLPIFVGGSPLYMKGLLRGFYGGPAPDWEFREAVQQDVAAHGSEALHRRLAQVDPLTAHRLPHTDVRRITRALEVAYLTGQPLSHWQHQFETERAAHLCRVFALDLPRAQLRKRIAARVDTMFADGLIDEVRAIQQAAADPRAAFSRTAGQAVGYRETLDYLAGQLAHGETIEAVKTHTRQLAKRQLTWLRSLSEVRAIDVAEGASAGQLAQRIARLARPAD
jgi:tRNA dimethylallyltransferase